MTSIIQRWGEGRVQLTWHDVDEMPTDMEKVTSVHGFCVADNNVLLVRLASRGWEIPGGHIHEGETAEACLAREVIEEAFVQGSSTFIGYITVDNRIDPYWKKSNYPPVGYQLFFRMNIEHILPFQQNEESLDRAFIPFEQIRDKHHQWHVLYEAMFQKAIG